MDDDSASVDSNPSDSGSQHEKTDSSALKTKVETEETEEPRAKRARRAPERFVPAETDFTRERPPIHSLTKELKSWSESTLKTVSEYLQWKRDASNGEIASLVGKDKHAVDRLMNIINKTDWKDIVLTNGFGSGILVNRDSEVSSEKPLDFWHHLCSILTPPELNNSDQLAAVMKELAESADDEYGPIYEYLAMIMDDPLSTVNMIPKLSGIQSGIILEILHSIAIAVKESSHLHSLLRERAIAVMTGDWKTLKMPVQENGGSSSQEKRVSLHGLNPLAMPKDALAMVWSRPPSESSYNVVSANAASASVPLPHTMRSMSSMTRLKTGYKTMHLVHDEPQKLVVKEKRFLRNQEWCDPEPESEESDVEYSDYMKEKYGRRRIIKRVAKPANQQDNLPLGLEETAQ